MERNRWALQAAPLQSCKASKYQHDEASGHIEVSCDRIFFRSILTTYVEHSLNFGDYGARFVQNVDGKLGFNFRVSVRLGSD